MIWEIGSSTLLEVDELTDEVSGAYINDATVAGQLYTDAGVAVGSAVTMSYVAASNGKYQGTIPAATMALTAGSWYYALITATSGSNVRVFRIRRQATRKDVR